ncbi:hypothetical protein ACFOUO_08605 [Salinithrix halophila]|uniref:Uncharacterized protein n=1 Tax=Salinithrix halophila TaxID=1485204 RepID=A0ABV8JGH1_9BACL
MRLVLRLSGWHALLHVSFESGYDPVCREEEADTGVQGRPIDGERKKTGPPFAI